MTSTEAAASSANDVSRSCLRAIGSAASSSARHRSGYSVTNRLGTTIRVPLPYEHQEPFELFVVARPLPEIDEAGDDLDVSSNILSRAVDAVARRVEGAVPVLGKVQGDPCEGASIALTVEDFFEQSIEFGRSEIGLLVFDNPLNQLAVGVADCVLVGLPHIDDRTLPAADDPPSGRAGPPSAIARRLWQLHQQPEKRMRVDETGPR